MSHPLPSGDRTGRSVAWSGAYLIVTRVSALVAVPVLLHAIGTDLYAVWVLASSLVFAQGLVDLGFSAALVRFVAIGAAGGSARAVRSVLRRVSLVYAGLSLLGIVLWFLAEPVAASLPYLADAEIDDAVILLHYTAVAFALTNATTLVSAALQGLDRVAAGYRAQTLGSAAFVPMLVVGLQAMPAVHAVGVATVASYALQLMLLGPPLWTTVRRLPENPGVTPTLRAMLAMGTQWQVSSWADFATFQLPRIAAGLSLSSGAVLVIDLALRFGQAVATPLFALLPIVLPRASSAWARHGREGVRELLSPLLRLGVTSCLLLAATAVPVAGSAIETWSGHALTLGDSIAACCIAGGVLAHASTGVLSSVLLAIGEVSAVVRYKALQLAVAVPLTAVGAVLGQLALAVGLSLALLVPAAWFNARALRSIGVRLEVSRWLPMGVIAVMAASTAIVLIVSPVVTPAVAFLGAGAGGLMTAAIVLRALDPMLMRSLLHLRSRHHHADFEQVVARLR